MGIEKLKEEAPPAVGEDLAKALDSLGIDTAFVIAPEHRPNAKNTPQISSSSTSIPVIDLSGLLNPEEESSVIDQIREASEEWGFFHVINHGVPLELLENLERQAKEFFALPVEEKRKIRRNKDNPFGYFDSELTKNTRDWKEVFDFILRDRPDVPSEFNNQWPAGRPQFRDACEKWVKAVDELAFKILQLLARSLGLPPKYFDGLFGIDSASAARLNFYAKCPVPDLVLGVSRHRDQGAFTVLVQDEVGGLEVKRKDGEWIRVTPRRDAFVINLGDLMQVWTNDRYRSVEHRVVVNENKDRFSCPYFMFPSFKANIAPIDLLTDPVHNRPKYTMFNWGEFDMNRKNSNFKRLGVENLQIEHYAITD